MAVRFSMLHKLSAYLLAGLGLATLLFSGEMSPPVAVLVLVGYVASWFAEGRALTSPRVPRIWNIALVVLLVTQVVRVALGSSPVSAGVEFTAVLQISRLSSRRSARDYQQITVLAFLHLVAATVLVSDLSYAVCFIGFVLSAPWALSLGHLRREIEGNYLVEHRPGSGAAQVEVGRILASRRIVGPGFLLGTAALSLPLFAITASIFVVFPRIGLGTFAGVGRSSTRLTGFSDSVELGGFGRIRSDPTVVIRVQLPQGTSRPPRLANYWRGTTFDRYDGRRWLRTPGPSRVLLTDGRAQHLVTRFSSRVDLRLRVFLEPIEPPVVFLPDRAVAIAIPPVYDRNGVMARIVDRYEGDELRYRDLSGVGLQYDVFVSPTHEAPRAPETARTDLARYLQLPRLEPRVRALAQRLTAGADTDGDRAMRIARHLRERYGYTLDLPGTDSETPLEEFLFRRRKGHCEYFSTAMAVLLRSVGIPSRNVSGFVGGDLNRYGDFYTLRQSDAHSWVEAWLGPELGWRAFDPTPASRALPGTSGLGETIGQAVDALRLKWLQYVLSYGLPEQLDLSRRALETLRGVRRRVAGAGGRSVDGNLVAWFVLGAVAIGVAVLVVRRRRAGGSGPARTRRAAPSESHAVRLYQRLEDALRRAGHPRPAGTTPLEHARRLRERAIAGWDLVEKVTSRYVDARFGNAPLSPAELRTLEREIGDRIPARR
jgi:transglutaminase-like putative cysteine protease